MKGYYTSYSYILIYKGKHYEFATEEEAYEWYCEQEEK